MSCRLVCGIGFWRYPYITMSLDALPARTPQQNHQKKHQRWRWNLPYGKLTQQWKISILNRKYIFKGSIFHCYVSLPECNFYENICWGFTAPGPSNRPTFFLPIGYLGRVLADDKPMNHEVFSWTLLGVNSSRIILQVGRRCKLMSSMSAWIVWEWKTTLDI